MKNSLIIPDAAPVLSVDAILADATLLATVDNESFLAVSLIVRQDATGAVGFYCRSGDWERSPAARLSARDAELIRLRARIAELETSAAPAAPAASGNDHAATAPQARRGRPTAAEEPVCCLTCRAELSKGAAALRMHVTMKHRATGGEGERQAGDNPACP